MSAHITTDQTSGIRPLVDLEVDHVSGGNAAVAVVAAGLIAWGITYTLTHGTMGDAARRVLEQQKAALTPDSQVPPTRRKFGAASLAPHGWRAPT